MAKKVNTTDTVEENQFGQFNFLNQPVTTKVNKIKTEDKSEDEPKVDDITPEAQAALDKAKQEIDDKLAGKTKKVDTTKVEDEQEPEVIKEEDNESPFAVFAKSMYEKGILDLEDEKIESEEDLDKLQLKTIKNGIAQDRARLPEDAQKFLQFIDDGGRPEDFHKYYYNEGGSFEGFDITEEDNQKYVVREALLLEGYTEEEVADEINDAIDLGKLEKKAQTHLKKLQKIEKEQKANLLEVQKEYAKKQETQRLADWEDFKNGLFDKEEIAGFKFNKKMKDDTWDYMTKVIDKKTGLTQYQKDSNENADARYLFAYLLKNKWDIKSLEKQVETKVTSKLKSKLSNYSDTSTKTKTGIKSTQDVDKDSKGNPFAAFETMFNKS
jgi:hypothetical protein